MLKPPNTCGAGATNCGHIHVVVDPDVDGGKTCNGPGAPYNEYFPETADAAPGSTHAGLDYCAGGIPGMHKIVLEGISVDFEFSDKVFKIDNIDTAQNPAAKDQPAKAEIK